jgi:hypothetical protein
MTPIKIPKVDPDLFFSFSYYKSKSHKMKASFKFVLKKATIEGVEFQRGTEITVPIHSFKCQGTNDDGDPTVMIKGWKVNQILRFFTLEKLRNNI